jgi:hypothetical protein
LQQFDFLENSQGKIRTSHFAEHAAIARLQINDNRQVAAHHENVLGAKLRANRAAFAPSFANENLRQTGFSCWRTNTGSISRLLVLYFHNFPKADKPRPNGRSQAHLNRE